MQIFQIAVLMTCHNRRESTLQCLDKLEEQSLPEHCELKVFLVDDGSIDGTGDAIRAKFPEVCVIDGNANLFWNQGMRLAWKTAEESNDWDAYLWLNDDTMLLEGAIELLLQTLEQQIQEAGRPGIVVGSCCAPKNKENTYLTPDVPSNRFEITYGGRQHHGLVEPTVRPQEILTFNGNIVLVSRECYQRLGLLNVAFQHSFGDIYYGLQANKLGVPIWLTAGYLGVCKRNQAPAWRNPNVKFLDRIKSLNSPLGIRFKELYVFREKKLTITLISYIKVCLKCLFPAIEMCTNKKKQKMCKNHLSKKV